MAVTQRMLPALTLALVAPLVAEILPGATRFSSIFVFPIEVCVWGLGAVLIREVVRRKGLGWQSLLLLGLALSFAEEFLIQQTSVAPLVIQLKGEVYARAFGVNYLYLLWALIYESVFVVLVPIALTELLFRKRRQESWLNTPGLVVSILYFVVGACLAWFTWTRIARLRVFHLPPYTPPVSAVVFALAVIVVLMVTALRSWQKYVASAPLSNANLSVAKVWLLGAGSTLWAALVYGVVLLSFGIAPRFPPVLAVAAALALGLLPLIAFSGPLSRPDFRSTYALVFGSIIGSMLVSSIGFIWATRADLLFKSIVDLIAFALLFVFGLKRVPPSISTPM